MNQPLPASLPGVMALAFLGDAVYGLYVRDMLVRRGDAPHGSLHSASLSYVTAEAQAAAYRRLLPHLTDYEADLCRRAYNSGHLSGPKRARAEDYRCATALEALVGMLHYTSQRPRLDSLMALCLDDSIQQKETP